MASFGERCSQDLYLLDDLCAEPGNAVFEKILSVHSAYYIKKAWAL